MFVVGLVIVRGGGVAVHVILVIFLPVLVLTPTAITSLGRGKGDVRRTFGGILGVVDMDACVESIREDIRLGYPFTRSSDGPRRVAGTTMTTNNYYWLSHTPLSR